jgi:hypothetical protein
VKKMANGGLNAIQSYVAWNLHEPYKGTFVFEGRCDIVRWLETCQKYDMYVLLRPGPYICGEWEMGGFPWWFQKNPQVNPIRRNNPVYLAHIRDWWSVLFTKIKRFTYANGGNIIMVQIENEYAYSGTCDKEYLQALANMVTEYLGEVQLYTTDGPGLVSCGGLRPTAFACVDFGAGTDPKEAFEKQRKYNEGGPYCATEVWPGWFDYWGQRHQRRGTEAVVKTLDLTLQLNGSINFYMYIGGTNFHMMNGVGGGVTTSYDYDAQLSEVGDMRWKYQATLATIKKYRPVRTFDVKNSTKKNYGEVRFTQGCSVSDAAPVLSHNTTRHEDPIVMEELNVGYGFALYRTVTSGGGLNFTTKSVADRASVIVGGKRIGVIQIYDNESLVEIPSGNLEILVHNKGRSSGGHDHLKGLEVAPTLNGVPIKDWVSIGFDTDKVQKLPWKSELPEDVPGFYRGVFTVDEIGDTFLNPTGWTHGVAWVNGYNIGRYWTIGPQLTLYVPAGLLKVGENEVIVFETEHPGKVNGTMTLDDVHQISIRSFPE